MLLSKKVSLINMPSFAPISVILNLFLLVSVSNAQSSFRPKALVLKVERDASTGQYITKINQRTPLVSVTLVVHLGGKFVWVDCDKNYVSSSYKPVRCRSAPCSLARATACGECSDGPRPGCNINTCSVIPDNPFIRTATSGELAQDVLSIQSTDGSNPGRLATVPNYIFTCGPTFLLEGLARGATGLAGLGRAKVGMPLQLAAAFSFPRKFAICMGSTGVIIFGDRPYKFLPGLEPPLKYTPLYINPVSTASAFSQGDPSDEYFIRINSIRINDKALSINTSLLEIDSEGNGGTKLSTVTPYTTLETSIYRAFTALFIQEATAMNISRVAAVAPFDVCFSSQNVYFSRVGPLVPDIYLVLQGEDAVWRIYGSNSVVYINNVLCLTFVDGGSNPRSSIVMGAYQLENNLLQFDLAASKLGFSGTLAGIRTSCANFNFTSNT